MQEQIRQTFQTRRALLWSLVPRYQQASPAQKTLLLDVLVEWTGYTRKHAIKLLNHGEPDQPLCDSIVMSLCFASLRFPTQSVLPLLAPCKQLPHVLTIPGHVQCKQAHVRHKKRDYTAQLCCLVAYPGGTSFPGGEEK
ncbi:MAG TPA: hypothetical protein VFV38_40215 [Ktedonobacteraceae bacterium]|nr:hypothetical protein [Ktedonobacteraceae bacterium]